MGDLFLGSPTYTKTHKGKNQWVQSTGPTNVTGNVIQLFLEVFRVCAFSVGLKTVFGGARKVVLVFIKMYVTFT